MRWRGIIVPVLPDAVVSDLQRIYGIYLEQPTSLTHPHFTDDDFERWARLAGATKSRLPEKIAIHLARQFDARELTYAFCDVIMNDLFGVAITSPPADWSELFQRIYEAFDGGEYQHPDRPPDGDPVEYYTRPFVADILKGLKSA